MPIRVTSWRCKECRREFVDFDEARDCETAHWVGRMADDFRVSLNEMFGDRPKRPVRVRTAYKTGV